MLVCEPGQAISSPIVTFKPELDYSIVEQIELHNYVAKNQDRLIIVTFGEIVDRTTVSIEKNLRDENVDLSDDSLERTLRRVLQRIHQWSERYGRPERMSLPTKLRDKRAVQFDVESHPKFPEARYCFERLVESRCCPS